MADVKLRWPEDYINKIICGDCLDIMQGIPDGAVDLVLTDPPYFGREDLFDTVAVPALLRYLPTVRCVVFWPANCGFLGTPSAVDVWHKSIPIHPNSKVGNVAGHHYEQICHYNGKKKCEVIREAAIIPNFAACRDECVPHPTQKPLSLMRKLIAAIPSDIILDPFCGSGTTCVAAKQLGRKYIGIDISREYCDIAEQRLSQEELFCNSTNAKNVTRRSEATTDQETLNFAQWNATLPPDGD